MVHKEMNGTVPALPESDVDAVVIPSLDDFLPVPLVNASWPAARRDVNTIHQDCLERGIGTESLRF